MNRQLKRNIWSILKTVIYERSGKPFHCAAMISSSKPLANASNRQQEKEGNSDIITASNDYKTMTTVMRLLVLTLLLSTCQERQFIDGRSEILGISDTILNDSSIIEGHVYQVTGYNDRFAEDYPIWIDEISLFDKTDTLGKYSLKTIPGTYTIKCESIGNSWERLVETAGVKVGPNQRAKVNFYIGYAIE